MNKIIGFITLGILAFSSASFSNIQKQEELPEYAPEGMVAYAASYSSNPSNEPKYTTQNSTTFQYLDLGNTLKYYRGDSVKVGIIDSGINYDHEDFMVSGVTKVKGDSKYYTYQNSGWVYYGASSHGYSYIDDTLGHGTNVAATVAAAINGVGGLGLAPNVELYVYKVTNSSNGYEFGAIQNALMNAKTLGLDVINMSFQSYEHAVSYNSSSMGASSGCSSVLTYYLNQAYNAGITLVGAAGNYNTSEPSYPGSNDHVINVGSLNSTGTDKAPFSNYGSTIDLVAPGYVYVADEASNTAYTNTQGTSFSAPLVTAAIALYKQKNPSATPAQIESALYASCDPIDDSSSPYTNWAGHGSLNVTKFLGVVENSVSEIVINNQEITDEELSLEVGDTFDLDWTVNGYGSFDDSVSIYSYYDNVISVDNNGRITAIGEGSDYVVIESNEDSSVYASIYVTVTSSGSGAPSVSSVTISPSILNLDLNGTTSGTLTATVNGTNNPSQHVTWTSNNSSVATVNSEGLVTAHSTGNATITATSTQDGTKTGTCTVTVTDSTVHVTGVTLNKSSTSIIKGQSETLTATVSPNNATNKSVAWTSSNTSVATVSNGVVSVPSNATVGDTSTITVTTADGSYTATCVVTVADAPQTATVTFTAETDGASGTSHKKSHITISTNSGSFSSDDYRVYKGGTLTITSSSGNITSISFTFTSGSYNGGWNGSNANYSESNINSKTWSKTTTSGSSGKQARITSLTVTYELNLTKLDTPSPAYNDESRQVTWASVEHASKYQIKVDNGNYNDATSPYDIGDISNGESHTVYVLAKGDGINYSDSNAGSVTFVPSVPKTLASISISGQTTTFAEGDTWSFGGTVLANFEGEAPTNVTSSATFSGYDTTTPGNQTVTVSYTYQNITKTTTYEITVNPGTLSSISLSGQTTSYQKNAVFSFDGTCTATFANGYQKVVTPTSVSSPDMTTGGNKTITVSFTYGETTKTTTYDIIVNTTRVVMEAAEEYVTLSWTSANTTVASPSDKGISGSTANNVYYESGDSALRLGTGSGGGTINISSTTETITKIVVNAKYYGSSYSSATLNIDGTSVGSLTSGFKDYTRTINAKTCTVSTPDKNSRVVVKSIKVYYLGEEVDIGQTSDCLGLETFINDNLHMDYTSNLGYCKDDEHHYYSTAKAAFNNLNDHQRSLFTTHSAYSAEWERLSTWATFNGEELNTTTNKLGRASYTPSLFDEENKENDLAIFAILAISASALLSLFIYIKKKRKD